MKARPVDGLEPDGTLADNAERIVRVRLDELCAFMPRAADPEEIVALHDMRIAAKRLRYILEVTGAVLRPLREHGHAAVKDRAGPARRDPRLRRADPRPAASPSACARRTSPRCRAAGRRAPRTSTRRCCEQAPHARDHAGLAALETHLRARRALLFARFLELWGDLERKGFRARLEYARRRARHRTASSIALRDRLQQPEARDRRST